MLDSDVWIDVEHTREAVDLIARGLARWVKPANKVFRLTETATARLIAQPPTIPFPAHGRDDYESVRKIWGLYPPLPASGLRGDRRLRPAVPRLGRRGHRRDRGDGHAVGRRTRCSPHPLYHLHHPHGANTDGEAIWEGQAAWNTDLRDRYDAARGKPELMRVLAEETRALRLADAR